MVQIDTVWGRHGHRGDLQKGEALAAGGWTRGHQRRLRADSGAWNIPDLGKSHGKNLVCCWKNLDVGKSHGKNNGLLQWFIKYPRAIDGLYHSLMVKLRRMVYQLYNYFDAKIGKVVYVCCWVNGIIYIYIKSKHLAFGCLTCDGNYPRKGDWMLSPGWQWFPRWWWWLGDVRLFDGPMGTLNLIHWYTDIHYMEPTKHQTGQWCIYGTNNIKDLIHVVKTKTLTDKFDSRILEPSIYWCVRT